MNRDEYKNLNAPTPKIQKPEYSADDVADAVNRFKEDGGLVLKLPDQKTPINNMVPTKYGSAYETIRSTRIDGSL